MGIYLNDIGMPPDLPYLHYGIRFQPLFYPSVLRGLIFFRARDISETESLSLRANRCDGNLGSVVPGRKLLRAHCTT